MSIHDNVFDLINEIAEPTGPILSWKAQLHVKQFINNKEMDVPEIGKAIAEKLAQCSTYDFSAAITCFERVNNEHLLNMFLEALYTECDKERILVR